MNSRRKFLKLIGLGATSSATALVASTIGNHSIEEMEIKVEGVRAIDVKNTALYKDYIEKIVEVVNHIPQFVGNEEHFEKLYEFSEDDFVEGDITDETFALIIEGFEDIEEEACRGNFNGLEYFKSTWMSGVSSEGSVILLMSDFEDKIPNNLSRFYDESSVYTSSYQSEDSVY